MERGFWASLGVGFGVFRGWSLRFRVRLSGLRDLYIRRRVRKDSRGFAAIVFEGRKLRLFWDS